MYRFWGKASDADDVHLLVYHGLDVAAVGVEYLRAQPQVLDLFGRLLRTTPVQTVPLLSAFLAMHDVGKFSRRFQVKAPAACRLLGQEWGGPVAIAHHTAIGRFWWKRQAREWVRTILPLFRDQQQIGADFEYMVDPLAEAVLGHHGRPAQLPQVGASAFYAAPRLTDYVGSEEADAFRAYLSQIAAILMPESLELECEDHLANEWETASWWVAGLAVLADWIGSNTTWFEPCAQAMPLARYWAEVAVPAAQRACRETGITAHALLPECGPRGLFPSLTTLRPGQELCLAHPLSVRGPRLAILEDETGSGKTEAAGLLAARVIEGGNASGIAFELPTMATANAMFTRMGDLFERLFPQDEGSTLMALAHSKRMINAAYRQHLAAFRDDSDGSAEAEPWLADNRKKALLSPLCVGTLDQALMAAINTRHQALRLLGLAQNVLVADEIHACDAYMLRLLANLLEFHAASGGTAILLSATLPFGMRQTLVHAFARGAGWSADACTCRSTVYPLLTMGTDGRVAESPVTTPAQARHAVSSRVVEVESIAASEDVDRAVLRALSQGKCVCWIRNTVGEALEAYERLRAGISGIGEMTHLFHARFAACDRERIEQGVLELFGRESTGAQRAGRLVVATQVVEQSLDVDFDFMVTDLAPIDLIIQRIGRLCRHVRDASGVRIASGEDARGMPKMLLYAPSIARPPTDDWVKDFSPGTAFVYPHHERLWLTAEWFGTRGRLCVPADLRDAIEYVYDQNADIPHGLQKAANDALGKDRAAGGMAGFGCLDVDGGYGNSEQPFMKEDNVPTRLGDKMCTVRLIRRGVDGLLPWGDEPLFGWAAGDVSVRAWYAERSDYSWNPEGEEERACLEAMPDSGRWVILAVMRAYPDETWHGAVRGSEGSRTVLIYDATRGLRFAKE